MVEALKDLKKNDFCWRRCAVSSKKNIKYKRAVSAIPDFNDLTRLSQNDWFILINHNIMKANCIVNSSYSLVNYKEYYKSLSQRHIFEKQREHFITEKDEIAILASFPFFLLDYFDENFYITTTSNLSTSDKM